MSDRILDLASLQPDRPKVKFRDGSLVELKVPEDFSIQDRARIRKLQRALDKLQAIDELSKTNMREAEIVLNKLIGMFLIDAPAELIEKTSEWDKAEILRFFTRICLPAGILKNQTGEKSSPGFRNVMEETP